MRNKLSNKLYLFRLFLVVAWVHFFGLGTFWLHADEAAEKGRSIYEANRQAVVTVQLTIMTRISVPGAAGQTNSSHRDVTGTVVQSSGLSVLSLSATDPGLVMQNVMGRDPRLKMETELSDVRMLIDGSEIEGEVVWRDKDLDLAFVRPKSKLSKSVKFVDLSTAGKAGVLDLVIAINRLGIAVDRAYSASVERIAAIVQANTLYYVPDANLTSTTLGAPAFTLEGKPLGIFVMRTVKPKPGTANLYAGQNDNIAGIIIPSVDVLKVMRQVPPASDDGVKQN